MKDATYFEVPVSSGIVRKEVIWNNYIIRKEVIWNKYPNGTINIDGFKYIGYSIKDAVSRWRKQNPINH